MSEVIIPVTPNADRAQARLDVGTDTLVALAYGHAPYTPLRKTHHKTIGRPADMPGIVFRTLQSGVGPWHVPGNIEDLSKLVEWHERELGRLSQAGITIPEHYTAIVPPKDHLDVYPHLVTIAEEVQGSALSPHSLKDVGEKLITYYTQDRVSNEPIIADIHKPKQYIAQELGKVSLVDLDPYPTFDKETELRAVRQWMPA